MNSLALAALAVLGGLAVVGGTTGKKLGGTKGLLLGAVGAPLLYVAINRSKSRAAVSAMEDKQRQLGEAWEKLHPGSTKLVGVAPRQMRILKETATLEERRAFNLYACQNFQLYCGR